VSEQQRPAIEMSVPADGAYLAVVRTAAAGLAARLDFTLDDIEDLRIAVDEASSILLAQAVRGSDLRCRFHLSFDALTVVVEVTANRPSIPTRDGFAWTVLSALASSVDFAVTEDDLVQITLVQRRPAAGAS